MGTHPIFAFSTFSNCMTCCYHWKKDETKRNLMDNIKFELDNKSSVILCITPPLECEDNVNGHAYVLMNYNQEHKAVKLYDPRCKPEYVTI